MKLRENIILFGHIPQSTDVAIVNLEAPVTARGRPVPGGKAHIFRQHPEACGNSNRTK